MIKQPKLTVGKRIEQLYNESSFSSLSWPAQALYKKTMQQACQEPSKSEVHTAVRKLKNGKAPGLCGITAEMLKASGDVGILWLTSVIKQVWQPGVISPDWKKGIILPRERAVLKTAKKYTGISLLSIPGKVFAIRFCWIRSVTSFWHMYRRRRVQQNGLTPGRSTIDRIFTLNTIIQSRKEFQKPLWIAFVDLKTAFNSVDRMALWSCYTQPRPT